DLIDFGTQAGKALRGFNFDKHRWVRLRSLIPRIAEEAKRIRKQLEDFTVTQAQEDAIEAANGGPPLFPAPPEWCEHAQEILEAVGAAGAIPLSEKDDPCEPRPLATLRLTPQFGTATPPPPLASQSTGHSDLPAARPDASGLESRA